MLKFLKMGKIRVKTFGDLEQDAKDKRLLDRRAAKKEAKLAEKEAKVKDSGTEEIIEEQKPEAPVEEPKKQAKKPQRNQKAFHSKNYEDLKTKIDINKIYSLSEGLDLLSKLQRGKFDETVELHINTTASGISGNVTLPNGTGKKTRVAIADDALISDIEKGKIEFDILVAEPEMMPKLAKVAKILGPRGLMPNPKNGTITEKPEDVAKKYEGGQINFKTETKNPLLHLTVGKMSFGADKLSANIEALINAIKKQNILKVTLKSTMSPGIKIRV